MITDTLADMRHVEEHLAAALIDDPGCIDRLKADGVTGASWETRHLGALYDLLCSLVDRRLPTDAVELLLYLGRSRHEAARLADPCHYKPYTRPDTEDQHALNALSYLNHITSLVLPLSFERLYAEWVRRNLDRRLRRAGQMLQALPEQRGDLDTDGLLTEAESILVGLAAEASPTTMVDGATAAELARQRYLERKQLRSRGERSGVLTGLQILDDGDGMALPGLWSLKPETVTLVAARPGVGKTSLMLQIALNNLLAGRAVGIFSLEMGQDQLIEKLACMLAGVGTRAADEGSMSPEQEERYMAALDTIHGLPLIIDDEGAITPEAMTSKARRMKALLRQRGTPLALVCLDYVQLMGGRADNDVARVSAASRSFAKLMKELKVPGILVAQMNRDVDKRRDKTPVLSDLADTSQLEKDAYNVLFIHREIDGAPESEAMLVIPKARGGGVGHYPVGFRCWNQTFFDLSLGRRGGGW